MKQYEVVLKFMYDEDDVKSSIGAIGRAMKEIESHGVRSLEFDVREVMPESVERYHIRIK